VKVLVLSNLYPPDVMGGYEVCCAHMVDALRSRGHEVRVLTAPPRVPTGRIDPAHVRRRFKRVDIWSTSSYQQTIPICAHLDQNESHRISAHNVHVLLDELADFRPDVVFLHMLLGLGAMGLLACLDHLRVPWVWQLGDDVPVKMCWIQDRVVPVFAREFARQARGHFIAVSQQLLDAITRAGIALNGPVEIIPYGVRGPFPALRRTYHPDGRLRLVTAAGVLERQIDKGTDLAIEAVAMLRGAGHDVTLDIYGEPKDPYFAELILSHDLADRVRLRGFLPSDELTRRYDQYDLFLFPTRPGEPFGVAPLEAAARGCVPVISSLCGVAEWVVHGVHVLKAPRRADWFARVIGEVARGAIDLAALGRRGASLVRRELCIDALIARTEAVLRRAAATDRRGAGTADEAFRLAVLAEKLSRVLVQRTLSA
jgi:glycosyltransferase involved in cell wall biosynthesis